MARPAFTIVVPTFQRKAVVLDAVRAIARIEYAGPVELIVVVDGSTDGTADALAEVALPFPFTIVSQANAGLSRARNRGARKGSGDIVLFLDDDMICSPDILEQHARTHEAGADAVLGHIPLDPRSPPGLLSQAIGKWADDRARTLQAGSALTLFDLLGGHLSVRRSVFEQIGGFDESFTAGGSYGNEDIDFGIRLLANHTLRFNPRAVASQRYVVSPQDHMRQYFQAGQADVAFARKHPARAAELFALHGANGRKARFLLRPLAAQRWIAALARKAGIALAERYETLPRRFRSLAARLFFDARDLVYWSGVHAGGGIPRSKDVLILCYHAIADLSGDPTLGEYGLSPEVFGRQVDALRRRAFTFVSPDELAAVLEGTGRAPRKAAFLTFDDCYAELPEVARSVLAPRAIPALAFAVSGMASHTNEWDNKHGARTLRLLDAAGLQQLTQAGVEVGCHSRLHRAMPTLTDAELELETSAAADDLDRVGVGKPRFFAYPFGFNDLRSKAAVRRAGFVAGFGLRRGRASARSDRFDLPRTEILASDDGWRFWFKTALPNATPVLHWPARGRNCTRRLLGGYRRSLLEVFGERERPVP